MGLKKKAKKRVNRGRALTKRQTRKRQKQRIIPVPKQGVFLPFLLPLLGVLGAARGETTTIAKSVDNAKAKGKVLYLRPYKGYGLI